MCDELEKILRRDRSPVAENPFISKDINIERLNVPLESDIQKYLTNFSLITHGFGTPAMVAVFSSFKRYLMSMKSNYEKILNGNTLSSSSSSSSSQNFINSQNFHNLIPTNQSQLQKQQQYFNSLNSTGATNNSSSSSSSSSSTSSTPSSSSATTSSSRPMLNNSNNELGILKIEHKD